MTVVFLAAFLVVFSVDANAQFCETRKAVISSSDNAPRHVPDRPVKSEVESESTWLPSLDEAAIQALTMSALLAQDRTGIEYGGCLFADDKENPTKFYYTVPVTNNSSEGIRVSCKTPSFARAFVGLYHTHPIDMTIDGFSAHDIEVAEALNVTSYVGSMHSKNILRFQSCKTRKICLYDSGRCFRKDFSRGEVIGRIRAN